MEQLLTVDTLKREMYVSEDGKLIKVIKNVYIGKNGVSSFEDMVEGSEKTPLGLYNLGVAFGIHDLNIKYPYIKMDDGSFWVDDVKSKYYNCLVEINGNIDDFCFPYIYNLDSKSFSSAEHLIDYKKAYEYAVFIEYNVNNGPNDKGSAIFLHCYGNHDYTLGCVAISREDMEWIINYLDIDKKPKILIK